MTALSPWHAVILGLVEGITEFLPVSSTGHLIIASSLLGLDQAGDAKRNLDAFAIVIQGGAILAVVGLYWSRVVEMVRGLCGRSRVGLRLAINIGIAFIPAAVIGLMVKSWIESRLFHPIPVMAALVVGGVAMIFIDRWQRRYFRGDEHADPVDRHSLVDIEHLTWRRALLIGLFQCIALWPGTSRSMTTIVGGMLTGLRPKQAAEFSFLLGVPTLGAACLYSAAKNLASDGPSMIDTLGLPAIAIGLSVAAVSAALAVKWLVRFLSHHGLALFGWYRLALCAVLALLWWRGVIFVSPG
ncbi:MAG: undecaprenyl-diphosphate phosphatase [Phycisphaerales bacterium]|nr:undecaprenyl-diphosphate phosphatase [Phycisphaerales bacterium]